MPRPLPGSQASTDEGAPPRSTDEGRSAERSRSSSGRASAGRPAGARAATREALKVKIERGYMMIGTVVAPAGHFVPFLGPLGNNFKKYSEEAADAWLDLADEDPEVLAWLKNVTSASTKGNLIGVHLALLMESTPQGQFAVRRQRAMEAQVDQEMAARATVQSAPMPGMPARDQSSGGPGDTVEVPPPVTFQPTVAVAPTAAPAVPQTVQAPPPGPAPRGAAIVSPAQLGIVNPGQQGGAFPASGAPSGRAA